MVGVQAGEVWPKANAQLREFVETYRLGGVILYEGNLPRQHQVSAQETARSVASLTDSLQRAAFARYGTPLLIAADQEGGSNMVISSGITRIPNLVFLGCSRRPKLARRAGYVIGSEMKALGVNTVLAPVADVNNSSENDIIGKRAFGAHPAIVQPLSVKFAQGLADAGVLAVAKHFPGHGTATDNPHFKLPRAGYTDLSQLEDNDLVPFRALIRNQIPAIMTAHILVDPLDSEYPVTISSKAVRELLRRDLGFEGLVFTDDLTSMMGILVDETGAVVRTHADAAIRALEVGSDILVFGQVWLEEDPDLPQRSLVVAEFHQVYQRLLDHFSREENRAVLEQAVVRILAAKKRLAGTSTFDKPWHTKWNWESYKELLKSNVDAAQDIVQRSAVLITEHGTTINRLEDSSYFGPEKGPLSKNVIVGSGGHVTAVTPVFRPPDELATTISREWLPAGRISSVHLVYGWRNPSALQEAAQRWGEPVERLSKRDSNGQLVFQEEAIERKAAEVVEKARDSELIVFGVLLREHVKVLESVCSKFPPQSGKQILVLLFLEPYFVPTALYEQRNTTFLYVSAVPDITLASNFLFGRWTPKPVSHLSVSIPGLVNRGYSSGKKIEDDPAPVTPTPTMPSPEPRLTPEPTPARQLLPRRSERPRWPWALGLAVAMGGVIAALFFAVRKKRPAAAAPVEYPFPLPDSGENNLWYRYEDGGTAIIFVHGIFSDSRSCWLFPGDGKRPPQYWPHMIRNDPRFDGAGIYLGGYHTEIDAGSYKLDDCAAELFRALGRPAAPGQAEQRPVLDNPRVVFVCHSTGGIVVRYMLERYVEQFEEKRVGVVLIASPSYGSRYADRLKLASLIYKQKLGQQLQWGSWSLEELDSRFRDLVNSRRIPGLQGVEAVENFFIFHRKWLPGWPRVVTEESAGRYFGAARTLPKTDHFSSVKPDSPKHPAHMLLVDFWLGFQGPGNHPGNSQGNKPPSTEMTQEGP